MSAGLTAEPRAHPGIIAKTLLRCYSHEFEAVRGGRQIAQEIAQIDAAFSG